MYGRRTYVSELRGTRKNGHTLEEIAAELQTLGVVCNAAKVKFKMQKLTTK